MPWFRQAEGDDGAGGDRHGPRHEDGPEAEGVDPQPHQRRDHERQGERRPEEQVTMVFGNVEKGFAAKAK
ncbi:MAG: hypothetical protein ACKOHK_11745 [Planctomycetia bacterium]